ncbi:MAG TPA: hypothetical protein VIJ33_08780 [Solirubrobacteraceae bacterium]
MPEPAQLELVVVYDDNEAEALTRTERIRALLESLSDDGVLAEVPDVVSATLRPECLQALETGQRALLIADLMSIKRAPKGARLLRAVSQRDGVREFTWRIALTKRSHPAVATGLDGYAHAVVVYPPDSDTTALGEAITDVLQEPAASRGPVRVYPGDMIERYPRDLDRALKRVFLDGYDQKLAETAFREISDNPAGLRAARDTTEDPRWQKVSASSTHLHRVLRKQWGAEFPTQTIQDLLLEHLYQVSDEGVWQQINPEVVEIGFTNEVTVAMYRHERYSEETWLTPDEHELAAAFFTAARARSEDRGRITSTSAYTSVDDALRDEHYLRCLDETGLKDWDTCYAVLTIGDWWFDRKQLEQRLKVG